VLAPQSTAPPDAGRLSVLDIRTPASPSEVGRLEAEGPPSALAVDVERSRLYMAGGVQPGWGTVLQAVDVGDATRPRGLGGAIDRFAYGGLPAAELVFRDGLLFVAAYDRGFWILRPVGPGDPTPTATSPAGWVRARAYLPSVER
jgi:hypothetical protein